MADLYRIDKLPRAEAVDDGNAYGQLHAWWRSAKHYMIALSTES